MDEETTDNCELCGSEEHVIDLRLCPYCSATVCPDCYGEHQSECRDQQAKRKEEGKAGLG